MRITLIAPDIPDYSIEFAEMVAETANVLLCIPNKHSSQGYPQPKDRLEVEWLPWPRQRNLFGNMLFMIRLARRIRQWNPDVVHFLMGENIWTNLLPPLLRAKPILTTVHDVRLHPGDVASARAPRIFVKGMVRQSDAILVHGDGLRAEAAKILPINSERCFVLPHVPLWHYREVADQEGFVKPDDGIFRVLFFGRICEYKGLRYLLKAAPLVQQVIKQLKIVIAGSGDDFANCRDLISSLSCVEVHSGFIPVHQAARFFSEADMLALPYIESSQSGVLMIAMAFGLPVVSTEVGEIANTVKTTGMGLLVPPRDEVALAAAMSEIACNIELRDRFSRNAANAARGPYSKRALSQRVGAIYENLSQLSRMR